MIDPPRVISEEPTAVTPHGGIRGGESQQRLSYPTNPPAWICEGGAEWPSYSTTTVTDGMHAVEQTFVLESRRR